MNALDGASLAYLDTGGDGGVGDGAGDGGAGDGAPIANATLRFTDINGKEVTTHTDATGYYRVSLRGLKAPLVATVVRDGNPWKSMLVDDIVRAPVNRKFYTINLTGLTDKVASEVANEDHLSKTDDITPAAVARQKAKVPGIIATINNSISAQISAAGLNPNTFNPLSTPFHPVATDSYDKLLESVVVTRDPSTGFTDVKPKYSLGGSINGLGGAAGLTLVNGGETLSISVTATTFTFVTQLVAGTPYNVTIGSQPNGKSCVVNGGAGSMGAAAVSNVAVVCSAITYTLGGTISGLGNANGLVLSNGADTLAVAANASSFQFANAVPDAATYSVAVQTQPAGRTCSVANGAGTMAGSAVNSVAINCSASAYTLGGSISGLTASGLVLASSGQTLSVAANAGSFTFTTPVASGSAYSVTVLTQPAGQTCSVSSGTGVMQNNNVTSVVVSCVSNPQYTLGGTVLGGFNSGLVLASNGQTVAVTPIVILCFTSPCPQPNVAFIFPTALPSGSAYNVTVQTQPAGQVCTVTNGSGAIPAANVDNVVVSCTTPVTAKYSTVGSYPITDCVKDNSTGLMWEGKPTSGLRSRANVYTNYDDTTAAQYWNGSSNVNPTTAQINAATNSIGYVYAVNASALCGYIDWRMPTLTELQGLVVTGVSPAIDSTWFPNTVSNWYWTSTPYASFPSDAWFLTFSDGSAGGNSRGLNTYVRLVR